MARPDACFLFRQYYFIVNLTVGEIVIIWASTKSKLADSSSQPDGWHHCLAPLTN